MGGHRAICRRAAPRSAAREVEEPCWGCLPRRRALHEVPPGWLLVEATERRVRYRGRTLVADGLVKFDWPASGVIFSTTAARVRLRMDGGRNFFNVLIDGHRVAVLRTRSGVRDYLVELELPGDVADRRPLCEGQASQPPRVVELQKRTEARIGTPLGSLVGLVTLPVAFHGLLLEGGCLMDAPPAPSRRIEFVGDSETSGFGNLGRSQPGHPSVLGILAMHLADQDAHQAWPAFVAQECGADFHVVAWSGMGVLWNAPGGCTASCAMQEAYSRLLASQVSEDALLTQLLAGAASAQPLVAGATATAGATAGGGAGGGKLASWVPHIVVVYIGGNDWYSLSGRHAELSRAFAQFLRGVRALRPTSVILVLLASADSFCSCLATLAEQAKFAADMEQCWHAAATEVSDPGVRLEVVAPSPIIDVADPLDWGLMAHWSAKGHAKWARAVAPLVARHAGWLEGL